MNIFKIALEKELESFEAQNNIPITSFTDFELKAGDDWHSILQNQITENDVLLQLCLK